MKDKEFSIEDILPAMNKFYICSVIQDKLIDASIEQLIEITKILNI